MTTPINLNKARKAKARADQRKTADENAVTFGRSKAEKTLQAEETKRATQKLDGHKREP